MAETGSLSLCWDRQFFTLHLANRGWLAAELVGHLEGVLEASDKRAAILKLLGFTLELSRRPPPRSATHWIEIEIEPPHLRSNSDFICLAVERLPPPAGRPYDAASLKRLHDLLDRWDFTVELIT